MYEIIVLVRGMDQPPPRDEQQSLVPMTGGDLLGDVYVKYHIIDANKPLLITFSPAGTNYQEHDITDDFSPWAYKLAKKARCEYHRLSTFRH